MISQMWTPNTTTGRYVKVKEVLEEGAWHTIQGGIWEETWGRLIQTGGIPRENEDLGGKWLC